MAIVDATDEDERQVASAILDTITAGAAAKLVELDRQSGLAICGPNVR